MNGLPGNLKPEHIEKARARGEDFIIYHHIKYTLKELEDGAGISRVEPKPKTRKNVYRNRVDNSDGERSESGSDEREREPCGSTEPITSGVEEPS